MSLFECRTCKVLLPLVRDLQEQLANREKEWQEERKDLVDRILAATRPDALQSFRREPRIVEPRGPAPDPERPPVTPPPKSLLPRRSPFPAPLASKAPEESATEILQDPTAAFLPKNAS